MVRHARPAQGCMRTLALACWLTLHSCIAVDERLSEVAGALGKAGIPTEWGASALLVFGGRVIVRRGPAGSNDLLLHGVCGSEYYRVQSVLYQQTHVS